MTLLNVEYTVRYLMVNLLREHPLTLRFHWVQQELVSSCHQLNAQVEVIPGEQTASSVEVLEENTNHFPSNGGQGNLCVCVWGGGGGKCEGVI